MVQVVIVGQVCPVDTVETYEETGDSDGTQPLHCGGSFNIVGPKQADDNYKVDEDDENKHNAHQHPHVQQGSVKEIKERSKRPV